MHSPELVVEVSVKQVAWSCVRAVGQASVYTLSLSRQVAASVVMGRAPVTVCSPTLLLQSAAGSKVDPSTTFFFYNIVGRCART